MIISRKRYEEMNETIRKLIKENQELNEQFQHIRKKNTVLTKTLSEWKKIIAFTIHHPSAIEMDGKMKVEACVDLAKLHEIEYVLEDMRRWGGE